MINNDYYLPNRAPSRRNWIRRLSSPLSSFHLDIKDGVDDDGNDDDGGEYEDEDDDDGDGDDDTNFTSSSPPLKFPLGVSPPLHRTPLGGALIILIVKNIVSS